MVYWFGEPIRPHLERMRRSRGRGALWGAGFVLAVLLLVAGIGVSRRSGEQLQEATRALTHTI